MTRSDRILNTFGRASQQNPSPDWISGVRQWKVSQRTQGFLSGAEMELPAIEMENTAGLGASRSGF